MTHSEAVEELKKLAGIKVWSLIYETASYKKSPAIYCYVEDIGHGEDATTYAKAVENFKKKLRREIEPYGPADPAPEDIANQTDVCQSAIMGDREGA